MDSEQLLVLAVRVEASSADDQRHLIEQAAAHLALHRLWPPKADDTALAAQFFAYLNVGAFLDAAALLVPDRVKEWHAGKGLKTVGQAYLLTGMLPNGHEYVTAATPALALTAASLRARAASMKDGTHG